MNLKINNYDIAGTPTEVYELMMLMEEPKQAPKPVPKAEPPKRQKEVDWGKAKALRAAGWSYAKIGEELRISDVTVAAHLREMQEEGE